MPETDTLKTETNWILIAMVCVPALAILITMFVLVVHPGEVRTTDAQLDGHIHPINSRIAGTITWVNPQVEDTFFVPAGTILARLDRNDYQPTVTRLEGETEASAAQQRSAVLNVPITSASATSKLHAARTAVLDAQSDLQAATAQAESARANVAQAVATFKRAEDDRVRYEALVSTHEISRSEYDQRLTEARTTVALLSAAEANSRAAGQRVESTRLRILEREDEVRAAESAPEVIASARINVQKTSADLKKSKAALTDAELNLSYTDLVAPVGGLVGRKSMEVGQRVAAGQLMLTLVQANDVWVIANFRETQLRHMRVGQAVKVHIDSFDTDVKGVVESIGGATGSKYSVVAPDNATGNYVKVVQRVPVRIRIDAARARNEVLLPGMSIEVSVLTDPR